MKEQDIYDNKLRELVKTSGAEKTPENFTENVMDRIKNEPVPEAPLYHTHFSWRSLWYIVLGIAMTVVVIFFLNWSPFNLDPENIDVKQFEKIVPYFQSTVESFSKVFGFLTKSSLPLILGIGIVALIAIDRIIRKLTLRKSFLF